MRRPKLQLINAAKNLFCRIACLLIFGLSAYAVHAQIAPPGKFVGNIIQNSAPSNFGDYWNQITPENSGKWGSVESSRDNMSWGNLDNAYNYAQQNNIPFKQHVFVWGSQEPGWIGSLSQTEQREEVIEWIAAYAERYPNTDYIDVVNEPLHAPASYREALGGNGSTGWDWIVWSFETARQYCPNAKLLINEYGIINDGNATNQYLEIINILNDRGLVDGIGIQCHAFNMDNVAVSTMQSNLNALAATGLPIYVSELDMRGDDATQRDRYMEKFPVLYEHPAVQGITFWGYIQGTMWQEEAWLVSSSGQDRLAMQWLKEYLGGGVPDTYSLTVGTSGTGSVSLSPSGGTYNAGTQVTLTATAGSGYTFSGWSGDLSGSSNPASITMNSNKNVTAIFTENGGPTQYTLTVTTTGQGSVSLSPAGGIYDAGTIVTLTASADAGYQFDNWGGSLSGSSNPVSITMDGNKTVSASFSVESNPTDCDNPISISLPFEKNGVANQCYVTSGTINWLNSWNMANVEINGVDYTNVWSNNLPPRQDGKYYITYEANVGWAHLEINGEDDGEPPLEYSLTTSVIGQGSVSPSSGSFEEGTSVTITATAAAGYVFDGWSGNASGSSTSVAILMDGNKTVVATFTEEDVPPIEYSLTTSVNGQGTVNPASGTFEEGTLVTLTASAASGYIFDSWSGDASGSSTSVTILMDGNKTVVATFTEEDVPPVEYSLTTSVIGQGTVNPASGTFEEGTLVTLTATAASGYIFDSWSGDASGSSSSVSITMNANKTIVATFIEEDVPPGDCDNPISISSPYTQNGAGEYCWVITREPAYINSWNLAELTINGADYTNTWSNSLPPAQNGQWLIHYRGEFGWSHFEMVGTKTAKEEISSLIREFSVYPNPFSSEFTIDLSQINDVQKIEIVNTLGQIVKLVENDQLSGSAPSLLLETNEKLFVLRVYTSTEIIQKTLIKE